MMSRNKPSWFNAVGYVYLGLLSLLCILPLLFIVSGSITSEQAVIRHGYGLIPEVFSLDAYKLLFRNPTDLFNAFFISVSTVAVGTSVGLFVTAMTGYVLSRKDFKYRNFFSFLIYFTSVFSGGLVPWYLIMVEYLDFKNHYHALIFPMLLNVFYVIVMKAFMSGIPYEIIESGKIDGANEFSVFVRLVLPAAKPALATIGLFIALGYWNDFFSAMLFVTNQQLIPLQYYLYKLLNAADAMMRVAARSGVAMPDLPKETVKLAMTVIVVVPILFVYPFVQKYIVGGVTLGAVKG